MRKREQKVGGWIRLGERLSDQIIRNNERDCKTGTNGKV